MRIKYEVRLCRNRIRMLQRYKKKLHINLEEQPNQLKARKWVQYHFAFLHQTDTIRCRQM